MASRKIHVEIVADTRRFERALKRTGILIERSWWRRLFYRIAVWRLDRDIARRP